jgi:hypothetical protein
MRLILVFVLLTTAAFAQQIDKDRAAGAVPSLVQQRNNAMDALAVCNGDVASLQQKLLETQTLLKAKSDELETLKKLTSESSR